jgi:hypothetical protein
MNGEQLIGGKDSKLRHFALFRPETSHSGLRAEWGRGFLVPVSDSERRTVRELPTLGYVRCLFLGGWLSEIKEMVDSP